MSVFRPRSERALWRGGRAAGLALAGVLALAGALRAEAPRDASAQGASRGAPDRVAPRGAPDRVAPRGAPDRVVSINLCTDQLALMLAAPGQLVSVSRMAHDPRSSVMAETARRLPANSALAEDVFLHRPDLVLAGTFTSRATVSMLRRLGIEVVEFSPAYALKDVPDRLRAVGAALGRQDEAERAVARFESDLAALRAELAERPRAALYYANGYTNGDRTLAGDIIAAAGFANVASELGLPDGGFLALEQLVMAAPELVVTGQPHRGEARAEAVLTHPALEATGGGRASTTDRDWICGTPHVLRAVEQMAEAREALAAGPDDTSGRER